MYISPISLSHPRSIFSMFQINPYGLLLLLDWEPDGEEICFISGRCFLLLEFFMNYEETELCHRIHKAKFDIYSVPLAKITHLGGSCFLYKSNLVFIFI